MGGQTTQLQLITADSHTRDIKILVVTYGAQMKPKPWNSVMLRIPKEYVELGLCLLKFGGDRKKPSTLSSCNIIDFQTRETCPTYGFYAYILADLLKFW